jgi:ubiquinone/menaquinone biosynthesis C-methylase UbiE
VKRTEPGPGHRQLFDDWPERYDQWFETPIGRLVREYERDLIMDLLRPQAGDLILDAGCGTGVFTEEILTAAARVAGLDLSLPMVKRASENLTGFPFVAALGDILRLPFPDASFDRVVSVTAMEFIADGHGAVRELFRVTRKGGTVVVATLNSLSPWAERRLARAERGESEIFRQAIFRSPEEMIALGPAHGEWRTAIHFLKDEDPARAPEVEEAGRIKGRNTGAFLAVRWIV